MSNETLATEALFLSGSLALDLINTEMVVRGKKHDVLSSSDALARWWEEACRWHPESRVIEAVGEPLTWKSTLLDDVKALRTALRTLSTHVVERQMVEKEDLAPVNVILALGYSSLERTAQGNVKSVVYLRNPEKGNVLFPIAMSALRLFTESDWQRLHKCKNDRCTLFFYDTTKSGTRHWCSLSCMNRSRSIRHYQATKKK
jgi:predicted RNA-binding Zn ribbon-like protein